MRAADTVRHQPRGMRRHSSDADYCERISRSELPASALQEARPGIPGPAGAVDPRVSGSPAPRLAPGSAWCPQSASRLTRGRRMTDTLSIRDNRTGREYELAITDGTIRAADLKQIAVDDEPGLATYDPGFVNTASCRSVDHLHRRRRGHPGVPRLPDRAAGRALDLPRGRLPAAATASCRPRRSWTQWVHDITYHTFLHENLKQFIAGLPLRRAPDGHADGVGQRAVDLLPRRQQHRATRTTGSCRSPG